MAAENTMATCTDTHDLNMMLSKRSSPGPEMPMVRVPSGMLSRRSPGAVKTNGSAASTKGNASAARL